MPKLSRFFVLFLFSGLFTAHAPMALAEMQQGYNSNMSVSRSYEPQHRSYGGKVGNKALSAFANMTTSWLEIPKNMINTSNDSNVFYGIVGGLFKGVVVMAGRLGVGVADLVTFPLPTQPIAYPLYVWDDFDVDTTFGPAFRLDQSQEEEPPVVQSPVAEPVVAAPVAPKPQPIDNSKQYRQETNHKLDEVFKKEMKK